MKKNLIIVESPTKSKTITKFLGKNYAVKASMGHLRDLPKSTLGVDVEHDFTPKYINIRGKGDLIRELKAEAAKADKVYLATDPDREGEAISWHLAHILGLDDKSPCRIEFNEITSGAVKEVEVVVVCGETTCGAAPGNVAFPISRNGNLFATIFAPFQ